MKLPISPLAENQINQLIRNRRKVSKIILNAFLRTEKKYPRKRMEENAELENYLDCETSSSDPMQFWRENQSRFPRLAVIAKQTFCALGRTAAVEKFFSIAGYILSQRRTRITDDNFQNQLFANVKSDLPEVLGKKLRLEN